MCQAAPPFTDTVMGMIEQHLWLQDVYHCCPSSLSLSWGWGVSRCPSNTTQKKIEQITKKNPEPHSVVPHEPVRPEIQRAREEAKGEGIQGE